jgi:hypothetical protein
MLSADIGRKLAAVATALAGAVHYAVVPEHRAEWWVAAVLFTAVGALQLSWAVVTWRTAGRGLLLSGLGINAAALGAWAVSRTSGLPFGPHAGLPESVGVADLACVLAEAVAVVAVAAAVVGAARLRARTA